MVGRRLTSVGRTAAFRVGRTQLTGLPEPRIVDTITGVKARFPTVSRGTAASKQSCLHRIRKPSPPIDLIISRQLRSRNGAVGWTGNKSGEVTLPGEWPYDSVLQYVSWVIYYFDLLTSSSWLMLLMCGEESCSLSSDSRRRAKSIIFISGSATWFLRRESGGGREEGECNRRGRIF